MPRGQQSVQFEILQYVAQLVEGDNCRLRPYAEDELPAINVVPEEQDAEIEADDTGRMARFSLRHIASGTSATVPAAQAADALYVKANCLLLQDTSLGNRVRTVREVKHKWEREQAETQIIALDVTYEVEFSTLRSDPSQPGY